MISSGSVDAMLARRSACTARAYPSDRALGPSVTLFLAPAQLQLAPPLAGFLDLVDAALLRPCLFRLLLAVLERALLLVLGPVLEASLAASRFHAPTTSRSGSRAQ